MNYKINTRLVFIALIFILAGCGGNNNEDWGTAGAPSDSTDTEDGTTSNTDTEDSLDSITNISKQYNIDMEQLGTDIGDFTNEWIENELQGYLKDREPLEGPKYEITNAAYENYFYIDADVEETTESIVNFDILPIVSFDCNGEHVFSYLELSAKHDVDNDINVISFHYPGIFIAPDMKSIKDTIMYATVADFTSTSAQILYDMSGELFYNSFTPVTWEDVTKFEMDNISILSSDFDDDFTSVPESTSELITDLNNQNPSYVVTEDPEDSLTDFILTIYFDLPSKLEESETYTAKSYEISVSYVVGTQNVVLESGVSLEHDGETKVATNEIFSDEVDDVIESTELQSMTQEQVNNLTTLLSNVSEYRLFD